MRYVGDHCCLFISVFSQLESCEVCSYRYGVMSGRYRSALGSNFHLCVSRFKFSQWTFFDGCVNADNVIRQHCFSLRDELRFGVAQFMRDSITLRDSVSKCFFLCFV